MKKFENILVAFDLNKTLFFKSESPLPRMHDSKIKKRFFYVRPHIKELVEFLHSRNQLLFLVQYDRKKLQIVCEVT